MQRQGVTYLMILTQLITEIGNFIIYFIFYLIYLINDQSQTIVLKKIDQQLLYHTDHYQLDQYFIIINIIIHQDNYLDLMDNFLIEVEQKVNI